MAQINAGYTRRTELKCSVAEADMYGAVVLYDGETIYIQQTDGTYAVKMGDGKTPISDLPYIINYKAINDMKAAAEQAQEFAELAMERAAEAMVGAERAVASLDIGIVVVDGKLSITFEEDE